MMSALRCIAGILLHVGSARMLCHAELVLHYDFTERAGDVGLPVG